MDLMLPIFIGFVVNMMWYFLMFLILRNQSYAVTSSFMMTLIVIVTAYFVGEWQGIGLFVVSIGMLLAAFTIVLFTALSSRSIQ